MKTTITKEELNPMLKDILIKAFENKDFKNLSNFERRKCVFEHLVQSGEYDFNLLNDIYTNKRRNYLEEILSVVASENSEDTRKRSM